MKILIFSQFFPPEIGAAPNRMLGHARYWAQNGHDVTVVTNVPNSPFGKVYPGYRNSFLGNRETIDGVQVLRVPTLASGKKNSKLHRALSFLTYLVMSALGGFRCSKPDVVLASAPYLAGIPGVVASIYHGAPLIYEMRDPWVQVAVTNGAIGRGGPVYKLLFGMERGIAGYAKKVVVVSKEMAHYIREEMRLSYEPEFVNNGVDRHKADVKDNDIGPIDLPEAKGRFVIGAIGNMGNQYDFDVLLAAASQLSDENCFFLFLGEGAQKRSVQAKAEQEGLSHVRFYPAVQSDEVVQWMRLCNVTVVSMRKAPLFRVYLPMKVLDSLMLGVPVLFGGSGEVERILRSSGGGAVFPSGGTDRLVELIKERMKDPHKLKVEGHSGNVYVCENFTRDAMAKKYQEILKDVVSGGASRS